MKRLFALLMAMLMTISITGSVFAAEKTTSVDQVNLIEAVGAATSTSPIYGTGNAPTNTNPCTLIVNFRNSDDSTGTCQLTVGNTTYTINVGAGSYVVARDLRFSVGIPIQWEISGQKAGMRYVIRMYSN